MYMYVLEISLCAHWTLTFGSHITCRADSDVVVHLKGSEVTISYFEQHGFKLPIVVDEREGLGMRVPPPDFKISDVERYVGELGRGYWVWSL